MLEITRQNMTVFFKAKAYLKYNSTFEQQ